MAKSDEEKVKDKFDSLQRSRDTAAAKLGKNNSATKADGDENKYAAACKALLLFGNEHGITNKIPLRKKYLRGA